MRLGFFFQLQLSFSEPVRNHAFAMRCLPISDERQKVLSASVSVLPRCEITAVRDAYGLRHYGTVKEPHAGFAVQAEGTVEVFRGAEDETAPQWQLGPFRRATPLTAPGPALRVMNELLPEHSVPDAVMALLEERFAYLPSSTTAATTAEQAAGMLHGVCQDEAHIMLALLRMRGIACRYVMGYMLGEGSTHAWVEVLHGNQWIAMDPTNHCMADDQYIRVAVGRDADDCCVNRGVFAGTALQNSQNSLSVWCVDR